MAVLNAFEINAMTNVMSGCDKNTLNSLSLCCQGFAMAESKLLWPPLFKDEKTKRANFSFVFKVHRRENQS